jgi:RecB family exonuclease
MLRLSNSEVETFQRCRRQHYWEYVQRLEPIAPLSPMRASEIGTAFHREMECYYSGESQADLIARLQSRVDELALTVPDGELHKAASLVLTMVEGYFDWIAEEGVDQGIDVIAPETAHSRTLPDLPDVEFIGKVDLETTEELVDFKTTKIPFVTKIRTLRRSRQLVHYAWLIAPRRHINRVRVRIAKQSTRSERTSPPYYAEDEIPVTRARLAAHEAHLRELVPQIQANYARTTLPVPTPGEACSWICPMYLVCDMADQGEDYQAVIDREFKTGDPLARYNEEDHA